MNKNDVNYVVSILKKYLRIDVDNVRGIEEPLLFVWDYKPNSEAKPLSLAFPFNASKCWASIKRLEPKKIDDIGPNYHKSYKDFIHNEINFFPYSIQMISVETMKNYEEFDQVCRRMHEHMFGE